MPGRSNLIEQHRYFSNTVTVPAGKCAWLTIVSIPAGMDITLQGAGMGAHDDRCHEHREAAVGSASAIDV